MKEGRRIGGRYEIVEQIAEGGMGTVYRARHTLSKKLVALKVLFPHIGRDEAARARFSREVAAPAQIEHDGIVEVYDAGFDAEDGSLFVAMELLEGETLRQRLARGGLTRDGALDLFDEMLEALAAAHEKGIVHRDLKPENVFLQRRRDGKELVKILDFGIARDLDSTDENVTQAGVAMGTPHYMAPEQAMSARDVSLPADVWSCGAMLYEALTGRTPFRGETASAIVVEACTSKHAPIGTIAPSTPAALASLVDRCLEKDPLRRPPNARALLTELRAARGQSADLPPTHFASHTPNPAPRGASPTGPMSTPHAPQHDPGAVTAAASGAARTGPLVASSPGGPQTTPLPTPTMVTAPGTLPPSRFPWKWVLGAVALLGALGGGALLIALGVGAAALGGAFGGGEAQVHITSNFGGQLYVDEVDHGPLMMGGHDITLPAGEHTLELRLAGAVLSRRVIRVAAGAQENVALFRGIIDAPSAGGPSSAYPAGGGSTPPVAFGSTGGPSMTRAGTLAPGDSVLPTGEFADGYDFEFASGRRVRIDARSSAFDTYLILRAPSGHQVDNDDGPEGRDASIDQILTEGGSYRITVTSFLPGETGPYLLTVQ